MDDKATNQAGCCSKTVRCVICSLFHFFFLLHRVLSLRVFLFARETESVCEFVTLIG